MLRKRHTALWLAMLVVGAGLAAAAEPYQVLDPAKSAHRVESEHFVARWNDADGVQLSDAELQTGLANLEKIWEFYTGTVGFPRPPQQDSRHYKADVFLSNKGWANGSGTGKHHPAMWLNYRAFKDTHALAHEFAHCLQFASQGMRDSKYVGWFWESHAEWMTHQMYPEQAGCSQQLVNAPHLYYGSTRNRYGNWQFWEYIKDQFGYSAINDLWTRSRRSDDPARSEESPLEVLRRNRDWSLDQLNDQFGLWAMHNVAWDYKNGATYRRLYGDYDDPRPEARHRVSLLNRVEGARNRYAIPDYRAPQRFGYNLVRIQPDASAAARPLQVRFQGLVQKEPALKRFSGKFENEPREVPRPDSDWRWGLVAVQADGKPRYSRLQRGASGELTWRVASQDRQLWLVVVATPSSYHTIAWDQMYYTIYRYPWTVEIRGGQPADPFPPRRTGPGAPHANGGGWVAQTARVDPSAYVGPEAAVLDQAQVLGNARVEDHAVVSGNATLKDQARAAGHALLTGRAAVGGKARVADEAAVYDGRIDDEASVGALSLVTGPKAHIRGQAVLRAVMNAVHNVELRGTVQLLGDIELHTPLSQGVFYGMVTPEMANNPRWGASRTAPEPEVTAAAPRAPRTAPEPKVAPAAGAPRPPRTASTARDVTFFVISDPHIGVQEKNKPPRSTEQIVEEGRHQVRRIVDVIGTPYPDRGPLAGLQLGRVARPRGLLIAGDLTDQQRWDAFGEIFPPAGLAAPGGSIPVFLGVGNHDGDPAGAVRRGVVEANRAHRQAGRLAAISDDGLHYALRWDGLHLLCLGLCPADTVDDQTPFKYGKPGPGSWNDPQHALAFMKSYLGGQVRDSGEPVVLMHHYGFDGFSTNDWYWWTPGQRRAYYDALQGYNVAAILHGHDHRAAHYLWPNPKAGAEETQRHFGDDPPPDARPYDVFSCGKLCWVFRVTGDRLVAAHYGARGAGWDADLLFVKPIAVPDDAPRPGEPRRARPAPARTPAGARR